jgi:four helix bundle protein
MFLNLAHTKLDLFSLSQDLTVKIFTLTRAFPKDEMFTLGTQMRRAALSVNLNFAEGSSRLSERDKKRFFEISRSSLIELDAALDIAKRMLLVPEEQHDQLGPIIISCFRILSKLLK